jgi:hypothetical protein
VTAAPVLHPDLTALQADLRLSEGVPYLPPDDVAKWRAAFARLSPADRETRARELFAVALKFQREIGDLGAVVVLALCDLAVGLIADGAQAEALAASLGVDARAAAKVVGAQAHLPVDPKAPAPKGASSLFATRLRAASDAATRGAHDKNKPR